VKDVEAAKERRHKGKEADKQVVNMLFGMWTALLLRECVTLWETLLLFDNSGLLPS
jgi:hypothetical protein